MLRVYSYEKTKVADYWYRRDIDVEDIVIRNISVAMTRRRRVQ